VPLPLPLSTDTVWEFHAEAHRQLEVKDLPKVPTWWLERDSNPRPFDSTKAPACLRKPLSVWWQCEHVVPRSHLWRESGEIGNQSSQDKQLQKIGRHIYKDAVSVPLRRNPINWKMPSRSAVCKKNRKGARTEPWGNRMGQWPREHSL